MVLGSFDFFLFLSKIVASQILERGASHTGTLVGVDGECQGQRCKAAT